MLKLADGMILYHGSYTEVSEVDLARCNEGLDFGRGFYTTPSYQQARAFVPSSVRRNIRQGKIPVDFDVNDGRISIYRFRMNPNLKVQLFASADEDWLHYVAANRNSRLFPEVLARWGLFDIVGGKIADDDTARVLNGYVTGLYGTPGERKVDGFVINSLLPNRLEDQFCIKSEIAIGSLEFLGSERYGKAIKR